MRYFVFWCGHSRDSNGFCCVNASWVTDRGMGTGGVRGGGGIECRGCFFVSVAGGEAPPEVGLIKYSGEGRMSGGGGGGVVFCYH